MATRSSPVGPPRRETTKQWAEVGLDVGSLVAEGDARHRRAVLLDRHRSVDRRQQGARESAPRSAPMPTTAAGARTWNDANVLVMSLRLTSTEVAREMLDAWFATRRSRRGREHRPTGGASVTPSFRIGPLRANVIAPAPERVAEVSRRLRARADGMVAELWFMPESQTGYPTLGIGGAAGTFGGRTGPLGALPGRPRRRCSCR